MQRLALPALPFLTFCALVAARQDPGAASAAPTLVLARRDFAVPLEREGSFVPAEAAEIQLWPDEYSGDWMFLEVLPHGTYVNSGDVIARLDQRRYADQLHDAELDFKTGELTQRNAEEQARMEEERAREEHTNARAALERARKDLKGWEEFELAFRQRQNQLSDAYSQDNIADQEDELSQLEAMYRDDELVDATEEIVLKRSRRQLARSREGQELQRDRRRYDDEYEIAVQTETRREALRNQESAFQRLERSQELERRLREDRVARGADRLQRQQERLEALRRDGALFEVRAPRSGVLLHGAPDDYGPGKTPPRHERAGRPGIRATLFSIADPDRMRVALFVDEADLPKIRDGMGAEVTAAPAPGQEWVGSLRLERFPAPGQNRYAGSVELAQPVRGLAAGMKAGVQLVTETQKAVFVLPRSAVFGSGDDAHVFVAADDGSVRSTPVKLGAAHGNEVVVEGALAEGARVLLAEPAQ
ncbi:MAG: HlyD family efflux transporter periplasmic adaptor subunit [Planctomycetota bacterium]|nr:MAG: HlyD family efflux transporter periplasmic adaptor subunit [Planctomycetota bacterium]